MAARIKKTKRRARPISIDIPAKPVAPKSIPKSANTKKTSAARNMKCLPGPETNTIAKPSRVRTFASTLPRSMEETSPLAHRQQLHHPATRVPKLKPHCGTSRHADCDLMIFAQHFGEFLHELARHKGTFKGGLACGSTAGWIIFTCSHAAMNKI